MTRTSSLLGLAFSGGALMLVAIACGAADNEDAAGAPSGTGGASAFDSGLGGFNATGGGAGQGGSAGSGLPPEKELESSFRVPVTTSRFVWSANPDSGRVALIDASSLELTILEAGFAPTYLAAVSDPADETNNAAIVLNVLSHDATLFRVAGSGKVDTTTLPTHQGANSWAVSKDGGWAIAWTDPTKVTNPDPTDGFQDVTVLHLTDPPTSTRLTVGYRPTRLSISSDGTRAFAVTEPGVSVIELSSAPEVTQLVPVTDDPLSAASTRDVSITPDGSMAVVRNEGDDDVLFIDLSDGSRNTRTLSGPLTDLDLSADGSLALAVVRDQAELFLLPIPEAATNAAAGDSVKLSGELVGSVSVSENSETAALYSNATANDRISTVDLRPGAGYLTVRSVSVKAPVQAVFPAPDGAHLIALSSPPGGSSKKGAFSLVAAQKILSPKVVGTDAVPIAVGLQQSPTGRGLIAVRDDVTQKHGVYMARMPSLQVDFTPLSSPPLSVGIVQKAGKGYVAQQHPEGRITFIDLTDGSARTLTGFELGAKVVD